MKAAVKKITVLLVLVSVVMVMCGCGANSKDFSYRVMSDGTVEITGYRGSGSSVKIPSKIEGARVTAIGDSAFNENNICMTFTNYRE